VKGLAVPVALFALAIMSVLIVAMMTSSADELSSSQAHRESAIAFYAAEAGLHEAREAARTNSGSAVRRR
jgi:Tfp pilus assembly protein PilX